MLFDYVVMFDKETGEVKPLCVDDPEFSRIDSSGSSDKLILGKRRYTLQEAQSRATHIKKTLRWEIRPIGPSTVDIFASYRSRSGERLDLVTGNRLIHRPIECCTTYEDAVNALQRYVG